MGPFHCGFQGVAEEVWNQQRDDLGEQASCLGNFQTLPFPGQEGSAQGSVPTSGSESSAGVAVSHSRGPGALCLDRTLSLSQKQPWMTAPGTWAES